MLKIPISGVRSEVVGTIGQITSALQALDPSQLGAPGQLALQAAVALLPADLTEVTDSELIAQVARYLLHQESVDARVKEPPPIDDPPPAPAA